MTCNQNNIKYTSALAGLPFEARKSNPAVEFRTGRGRKMEAKGFYLRPILREKPDVDRLGRAILELALQA